MKWQMSYGDLLALANAVRPKLDPDCDLIAITRGGLTFAQVLAYKMAKPIHFFVPGSSALLETWEMKEKEWVFLEDVVAKGRTFHVVRQFMEKRPHIKWKFVPLVLDGNVPVDIQSNIPVYGIRTFDWVVFPHESKEHTLEGDRGLFRERTSENSKPVS